MGLVSVAGGSLKILKMPKLLKSAPGSMTFSADGRYLITDLPQGEDDATHDIFAFSVDGREEIRIAEHRAADTMIGWIPNSNELLFMSDRTGTRDAWIVEFIDGKAKGEPRLVRRELGRITPLGLSRDGALFYRQGSEMTDIAVAAIDLEKRVLAEPPKTFPLPVVGVNSHPQWSPDGQSLAYLSNRKRSPEGEASPLSGSDPRRRAKRANQNKPREASLTDLGARRQVHLRHRQRRKDIFGDLPNQRPDGTNDDSSSTANRSEHQVHRPRLGTASRSTTPISSSPKREPRHGHRPQQQRKPASSIGQTLRRTSEA